MNKLITVSSIVTYGCLALLIAAFGLNAWGIVSGDFDYHCPSEFFTLIQVVLGASTAVWTAGGLAHYRREKAEEEQFEDERIPTVRPGKIRITDAEKPRYEEAIDVVVITDEKTNEKIIERDEQQKHLMILFPNQPAPPFDIEVSIPPKESN